MPPTDTQPEKPLHSRNVTLGGHLRKELIQLPGDNGLKFNLSPSLGIPVSIFTLFHINHPHILSEIWSNAHPRSLPLVEVFGLSGKAYTHLEREIESVEVTQKCEGIVGYSWLLWVVQGSAHTGQQWSDLTTTQSF